MLDRVDFSVRAGEAVGVVGPNGAGKTTLLSLLVGAHAPTSGRVRFLGEDVTFAPTAERCRRGLARTHQIPRPFSGMTVFENVFTAASHGGGLERERAYDRAIDSLALTAMTAIANRRAETLGLIDRKRLELARALATGPAVLLLDEIGGGLTDAEANELVDVILELKGRGIAIVWIEHIVHILLKVAERLVCMDAGRIIADGPPRERHGRSARDRGLSRRRRGVTLLSVERLEARYGQLKAVRGVSLSIDKGETVALVGANGAGKTTLLRTIAGAHRIAAGAVAFKGEDISGKSAHARAALGLALVPEGRRLFARLTVEENLQLARYAGRTGAWTLDAVMEAFPNLKDRRRALAGTLSGGEQQATAIGRALMMNPDLLLLDEVSLGLSPLIVDRLYARLEALKTSGVAMLLVEQDLKRAMATASRTICMLEGAIAIEGPTHALSREQVTEAYFGLKRSSLSKAPP